MTESEIQNRRDKIHGIWNRSRKKLGAVDKWRPEEPPRRRTTVTRRQQRATILERDEEQVLKIAERAMAATSARNALMCGKILFIYVYVMFELSPWKKSDFRIQGLEKGTSYRPKKTSNPLAWIGYVFYPCHFIFMKKKKFM